MAQRIKISDVNIERIDSLVSPADVIGDFPLSKDMVNNVLIGREQIAKVINGIAVATIINDSAKDGELPTDAEWEIALIPATMRPAAPRIIDSLSTDTRPQTAAATIPIAVARAQKPPAISCIYVSNCMPPMIPKMIKLRFSAALIFVIAGSRPKSTARERPI